MTIYNVRAEDSLITVNTKPQKYLYRD